MDPTVRRTFKESIIATGKECTMIEDPSSIVLNAGEQLLLLTPKERAVVEMRYRLLLSQFEIAKKLGCTEQNVSATEKRGLLKLRKGIGQ